MERIKRLSEYKVLTKPTYDGDDGRKDCLLYTSDAADE